MVASLRKLKAWTLQQHGSRGQGSSLAEAGDRLGSFFTQAKQGCYKQSFYQLPGRNSDELRMVRGITVQHPAQIMGGHRRFVAKILGRDLCAATTAQLRRGVPRLAGRFDLQWGTAQAWIAEGGLAGRTYTRASSSCCSLSLLVASSQVRQRRVRVRQRGVSLGQGPLARRDVSMVHQKLRRRWRTTCKLLHACCWQEWRSVPGAGA